MGAAGVGGGGERERGVKAGTGSRGRLREHRSGAVRIVVEMNGKEVAHPVPNLWPHLYKDEWKNLWRGDSEPVFCHFARTSRADSMSFLAASLVLESSVFGLSFLAILLVHG